MVLTISINLKKQTDLFMDLVNVYIAIINHITKYATRKFWFAYKCFGVNPPQFLRQWVAFSVQWFIHRNLAQKSPDSRISLWKIRHFKENLLKRDFITLEIRTWFSAVDVLITGKQQKSYCQTCIGVLVLYFCTRTQQAWSVWW